MKEAGKGKKEWKWSERILQCKGENGMSVYDFK